jgi:hypothetical protein
MSFEWLWLWTAIFFMYGINHFAFVNAFLLGLNLSTSFLGVCWHPMRLKPIQSNKPFAEVLVLNNYLAFRTFMCLLLERVYFMCLSNYGLIAPATITRTVEVWMLSRGGMGTHQKKTYLHRDKLALLTHFYYKSQMDLFGRKPGSVLRTQRITS